jgi:hypothetical protein
MNRYEVIEELESLRDLLRSGSERADRMAKSLRRTPSAAPAPEMPRDEQGYAPEPEAPPAQRAHTNGDGEFLELDMESLDVTDNGQRKTFKVKGGAYRKWGVFIWPEVLEREFGIDAEAIKPGLHPFKFRVRILMDGDKPKKVVGIVQ